MRIAIAEDDAGCSHQLQENLLRFGRENQLEIRLTVFSDGAELVGHYSPDWDLLLLDVDMPNLDGISAARCIRERDPEVLIMFITNLAQYAICGYEVDALDYVLKPVSYYALAMKLKKAMRQYRRADSKFLMLSQNGDAVRVSLSRLYYIEVFNHRLCYHTADGDLVVTGARSLTGVEQELAPEGFARCHNCYLVNLRYVESIQGGIVRVAGTELAVSRNRRKAFLEALLVYTKGGALS